MARRDLFGSVLAVFSPRAAYERAAWSQAYAQLSELGERGYAAAARDRKTNDWRATGGSADAEQSRDLATLRNRQRQAERDSPYVKAAKVALVTDLVGDGITARAEHPDDAIAAEAQEIWDEHCKDTGAYARQAQAVGAMIDGDAVQTYTSANGEPDSVIRVLEGDFIDHSRNAWLQDGGKIVQGVEYDRAGAKVALWLFPVHPGDVLGIGGGLNYVSERVDIRDCDHLFEVTRPGQSRGVPWFHAGLRLARDIDETEQAIRIKKRVEACLAVFRIPGESGGVSPLGEQAAQQGSSSWETLRPGMIIQGKAGEQIQVVNPSQSGDGDGFQMGQKMAYGAAVGVPYYRISGDTSRSNFTSLRADVVSYNARLDAILGITIYPQLCDPEFARVMRKASLKRKKPQLAEVTAEWTPPPRAWVQPLDDMTAEKMEMRSIPGAFASVLAARGLNWRKAIKLQGEINRALDAEKVALDTDPRRIDGMGQVQAPVGYLGTKPDAATTPPASTH